MILLGGHTKTLPALKYKVELNESERDTTQGDCESWRDFGS